MDCDAVAVVEASRLSQAEALLIAAEVVEVEAALRLNPDSSAIHCVNPGAPSPQRRPGVQVVAVPQDPVVIEQTVASLDVRAHTAALALSLLEAAFQAL